MSMVVFRKEEIHNRGRLLMTTAVVIGATIPDVDFLPGLLTGDLNRFHQTVSHSFLAAVLAAFAAYYGRPEVVSPGTVSRQHSATAISVGWLTHLLVDLLTEDSRPPIGVPLFWPLSETVTHFGDVFRGIMHGSNHSSTASALREVLSMRNGVTLIYEGALSGLCIGAASLAVNRGKRQ